MNLELHPEQKVLKKPAGICVGGSLYDPAQQKFVINSIESLRNLGESLPVDWISQGQGKK